MFSGCVRYCDILDVVLEAFYAKDGKNVLKSERNLYAGKMRVMVNPFPAVTAEIIVLFALHLNSIKLDFLC